jgi:NitT/TauT family transport system permease protein
MQTDNVSDGATPDRVGRRTAPSSGGRGVSALTSIWTQHRTHLAQIVVIAVFLAAWQWGSGRLMDREAFSNPTSVWTRLVDWYRSGLLVHESLTTLGTALLGFAIGSVAGTILAFLLSLTGVGRNLLAPLVFLGYSAPRLAFLPMLIIWLGIGIQATVVLAVLVAFMDAFFPAYEGAISVDGELLSITAMMRGSKLQVLRTVRFPASLAWVALGFSVAIPQSFGAVVFAQLFAGTSGLGYLLRNAANNFDGTSLIAGTVLVAAMAILINWIVGGIVGHYLKWQIDLSTRDRDA